MSETYDVIIIGAGPGGMTAAIYGRRAELKVLMIEKNFIAGGQVNNTYEIDNYPGLPGISGMELGSKFSEHADKFAVNRLEAEVLDVDFANDIKKVVTDAGEFCSRTVVLSSGNTPRMLGIPGEEELLGMGVSYCATCDGAFFKGKVVAVVGGGDVAVEDAIFLARACKKVYVIHRRDEFRAARQLQTALLSLTNVEVVWNSVVTAINGEDMVEGLEIRNVDDGDITSIPVSGVFVAVGNVPNASYIRGNVNKESLKDGELLLDAKGYILAGEDCRTNIPGVYAVGDVRSKQLRQVVTAVADGANAIYSAELYLG